MPRTSISKSAWPSPLMSPATTPFSKRSSPALSEKARSPMKVNAWLPSLAHYLFLDDTRTRNVVAEPRADNTKMIGYLQRAGFYKSKEFDFPHKRAAMMVLSREAFFDQFCP